MIITTKEVIDMLFDEIAIYKKEFSIENDSKKNYDNISKREALLDFIEKLNKL